jgi:sensor histidine kinase YesM
LKQSEKEKLKAELSYFKAQINPHFLFNTLNTIYSLAIQKAGNTAEAVVKLSGMMRYVLSDASHDYVALEKEIGYISDYIELQKIRFGETVRIDYQPCDPDSGKSIAPLVLIPFIENAFKFGVNPGEDSFIGITISLSGDELHLKVFNNKVNGSQETETTGGLGIVNAKHRLDLLYPEKHKLIIEDKETEFTVDLYINLP